MATALRPLNLSDFTGGLNLRADAFSLRDNESPEMLNVDVDPRGGVYQRRSWVNWSTAIGVTTWAPNRLHVFERSTTTPLAVLTNGTEVWTSADGTFARLSDGTGVVALTGRGQFVDWSDLLYISCGTADTARKWVGTGTATRLTANGPTWQDDYTTPTTNYFPMAEYATTYQGYMVVASTSEDGTEYPNRVRFSHPNNPENWAELDYVDILPGGARITGIVSFSDHIVVFKTNSVWAIYGNDADTFTPINVTMTVGAVHCNAIAVSEEGAYFFSYPSGVHLYKPGTGIVEVSRQLRPIMDSGELTASALDEVFLGFLNRKLWFTCPYERGAVATTGRATFVLDPSLNAWTLYRDPDGDGLGPFATGAVQGDGALLLACHRVSKRVVMVEADDNGLDAIAGTDVGFETLYATRWLHAGWPSLRKSWRRPDYVVSEKSAEHFLSVQVMTDYEEAAPKSAHTVTVETGATGSVWGTAVWGTAVWGATPRGAHIEKGGSIGLAKAVQLRFSGQVGKPWGLNAVVMKFRPRRFR